ncbi:2Fe-2S iron-sulfur cluster binding domain-containing protein [Paraburkholderia sp. Cy-641]|uniref:2Fe-2S iron-sulfur cluster-binding protein n=1 Tax=Paraburkholderia sp. Cy-641 TaxID=2608337 RepID=UPI00141E73CD|nr:2Fe-2S iron-sulfur cluster-binding protein [Paraburkholderia sp. Cy-641]NIF77589.1 2Fe-2S iron-sulfur cluster binding domain-containing protein [Paraburkholderia sp. Cy-641]
MQLHVQPTGQSIGFASGDNLLDTLRQASVPISYSCSAGRCGTCRCTLIDGSLQVGSEHIDSPSQTVLACQASLTGDCTIAIPEPDEIVVHPARILKGTVESIEAPVHDVRIVRFRTNRPLSFSPGQFATLQFGPGLERPYSMASVEGDNLLEFHIRIVPGGTVSRHVANVLRPGDTARIGGPLGTSYLRRTHDGPIICVGGGTGLAPVLSITRASLEAGNRRPVHLYFGVRSEEDLYGAQTLADLQRRYPNLLVQIVVASGPAQEGHRAGLVPDAIAADWPGADDLLDFRGYVCGSPPMVDAVTAALVARGLDPSRIYADAFFTQPPIATQPA